MKQHAKIISDFAKRNKIFASVLFTFAGLNLMVGFIVTDPSLTTLSIILNTALIGFLYGIMVTKATHKATLIYDYMKLDDQELLDKNMDKLETAVVAKNWFWVFAVAIPLVGALNLYGPVSAKAFTYTFIDMLFYAGIVYGMEASWFLEIFSLQAADDLISDKLERSKNG